MDMKGLKADNSKSFNYGGYTFVPLGQFTDAGYKKDAPINKIMNDLYFINRGCVADGHEKYNYDDFYKAAKEAGCGDADIFLCKETAEMYVPCQDALPIFDKTAMDTEEVMKRFNHRKEPCPINNGSDLNSDAMLEALFDDGQYIEHQEGRSYKVLGFIYGYPMQVDYVLGMASMTITCREQAPSKRISSLLRERLIDEQVEAEVKCSPASFSGDYQYWRVHFYYTPAYVVENFYPKDE